MFNHKRFLPTENSLYSTLTQQTLTPKEGEKVGGWFFLKIRHVRVPILSGLKSPSEKQNFKTKCNGNVYKPKTKSFSPVLHDSYFENN